MDTPPPPPPMSPPPPLPPPMSPPPPNSAEGPLQRNKPTELTRLFSSYLEHIDHTSYVLSSLLCPSLRATRSLYQPFIHLLDHLPIDSPLTSPQSHQFYDIFIQFDRADFTALIPQSLSGSIISYRRRFSELSQQLRHLLSRFHRTHPRSKFPQCAIRDAGDYLFSLFSPRPDVTTRFTKEQLKHSIFQHDVAARGSYVVDNELSSIDMLVARLRDAIEGDRVLIRAGLEMGRSDPIVVQQLVLQLRKMLPAFLELIQDLEEHVCLCVATLNRAKSMLLQEICGP